MRWSTRAPMMLRVRPAQFTTTVAFGRSRSRSWMRRASSPPGALRPPGMQKRWYSSGVRVSRMISSSPRRWRRASSSASMVGTWCCTSTFSPKSLLGTFMPHSVGRFLAGPAVDPALQHRHAAVAHALQRARGQRRAAAIVVAHHHLRAAARDEPRPCGPRAGGGAPSWRPGMWAGLYSPCSRTSISASVEPVSRRCARVVAAISRAWRLSVRKSARSTIAFARSVVGEVFQEVLRALPNFLVPVAAGQRGQELS